VIPVIETLPLLQLASGDRLTLQVYKFVGANPGKKAYLQANLHGGEIAGNAVIAQLMTVLQDLKPEQLTGELWLVPMCNPLGVNARSHHYSPGRFNSYDGRDWNRIFWDYETHGDDILTFAKTHLDADLNTIQQAYRQTILARFAQLSDQIQSPAGVPQAEKYRYCLQSLCLDADYVIDLHTSSDQGLEYVYYFRDRAASAALFLLETAVLLDEYDGDAFDEAFIKPWLALERCLAILGKPMRFDIEAYTLELGSGMQLSPGAVAKGVRGVQNYLTAKRMLHLPITPSIQPQPLAFTQRSQLQRYYAPAGGVVQARVPLGSRVRAKQRLYQLLSFNKEGTVPIVLEIYADRDGRVYDVSTNQAVNEGEYVIGVFPT